jgi:hypothetical protein
MANLIFRLAILSFRHNTSEAFDSIAQFKATRNLLGYDSEEAIRGAGDYSYHHHFHFVICATCGTVHRNVLLNPEFCIGCCVTCLPFANSIHRTDKGVSALRQSSLCDVPVEVADEINFLLNRQYEIQEFGY